MPDLSSFPGDYTLVVFSMLIALFTFNLSQAQLQSFAKRIIEKQTPYSIQFDIQDKLESYFLFHNKLAGVKTILVSDLKVWQDMINLNFQFNYGRITNHTFFQQMTPNIKSQVLREMIKNEMKTFVYLFQTDEINNTRVKDSIIEKLLSSIDCEFLVPG